MWLHFSFFDGATSELMWVLHVVSPVLKVLFISKDIYECSKSVGLTWPGIVWVNRLITIWTQSHESCLNWDTRPLYPLHFAIGQNL